MQRTVAHDRSLTVSVVIPTYQRAHDLERAVRSALAQTHAPLEVLVCDDGSTDDSEERIRSIGDLRVIWLPGPHAGRPAIPRNRGLAAARGEWIAFLDSDDTWEPNKLARQFERLTRKPGHFSCTNAWRIVPGSTDRTLYFDRPQETITFFDLLRMNPVICSSALVHSSILAKTGPFPEDKELKALEDHALWSRCAVFTKMDMCPEPLVRYTDSPSTSVRQEDVSVALQRERVLTDLKSSKAFFHLEGRQLKALERALRTAQGHPTLMDRVHARWTRWMQ